MKKKFFFKIFLDLFILGAGSGKNVAIDHTNVEYPSFSKPLFDFNRTNKFKNISLKTKTKNSEILFLYTCTSIMYQVHVLKNTLI